MHGEGVMKKNLLIYVYVIGLILGTVLITDGVELACLWDACVKTWVGAYIMLLVYIYSS